MKLYSDKLTQEDLERIAEDLELVLHNADGEFYGARKRRTSFTLRPTTERFRRRQNGRRLWAVSWDGHYEYMERLFAIDPDAKIVSAVSTWDGREDFHARARTPTTDWIT